MVCRGQPTGDASFISLYIAACEAARFTDAVCSGEGPDEMFCGYPCYSRYFDEPSEDHWLRVNTILDTGSGSIPAVPSFGGDGFLKMYYFDLTRWMYGNIVPNVVRAAKGAGLDIRMPYMRRDLLDLALAMPQEYKADRTGGKLIFREAARRWVGDEVAFGEKKGFPVPVRLWMRAEPWKTQVLDTLTGEDARRVLWGACSSGGADVPGVIEAFYDRGEDARWKQVWEMFAFMKWYQALYGDR